MTTIAIDIDNTLADYTGALRDTARRLGFTGPCPDPTAYEFGGTDGWPWEDTAGFPAFHRKAVETGLYLREPVMPGACDALHVMNGLGWRIIIATAREDDPYGDTRRWLDSHDIPYDGLYFGDKSVLDADVLIDDRPDTIRAAHGRGLTVLHPGHAYCRDLPGIAFDAWDDVPALLMKELR